MLSSPICDDSDWTRLLLVIFSVVSTPKSASCDVEMSSEACERECVKPQGTCFSIHLEQCDQLTLQSFSNASPSAEQKKSKPKMSTGSWQGWHSWSASSSSWDAQKWDKPLPQKHVERRRRVNDSSSSVSQEGTSVQQQGKQPTDAKKRVFGRPYAEGRNSVQRSSTSFQSGMTGRTWTDKVISSKIGLITSICVGNNCAP